MSHIDCVRAFSDNYIWLIRSGSRAVAIDPGDAAPVLGYLQQQSVALEAIWLTHHHPDHTGGVAALKAAYPHCTVLGAAHDAARLPALSQAVRAGQRLGFGEDEYEVLSIPGHTSAHIAFYDAGHARLFSGDTLFSAGCGRVFCGSAQALHESLQALAALPPHTQVYCTHEYTLSNLRFARAAEPENAARDAYTLECEALRAADKSTVPTTIARERAINPFLRCTEPQIVRSTQAHAGRSLGDAQAVFNALRAWKNVF